MSPLQVTLLVCLALIASTECRGFKGRKPTKGLSIVGGHDIKIEEVPYVARINIDRLDRVCTGTVLNKNFILTAANCFDKPYSVVIVNTETDRLGETAQWRYADKVICHEKYNDFPEDNNICLVKVKRSLAFSRKVSAIGLSKEDNLYEHDVANVTGWGVTENGRVSQALHQVSLPIVSLQHCSESVDIKLPETFICAGSLGHGICMSDMGAPLVFDGKLIGVAAHYPYPCGDRPDLFMRVSKYYDWIQNTMSSN